MNIERLIARHTRANKKWFLAVKSKAYPLDESKPMSESQKTAYRWANAWRQATRKLEDRLLADPGVRALMLEKSSGEEPTYHEAMTLPASAVRGQKVGYVCKRPSSFAS